VSLASALTRPSLPAQAEPSDEMPLKGLADGIGDRFGPALDAFAKSQSRVRPPTLRPPEPGLTQLPARIPLGFREAHFFRFSRAKNEEDVFRLVSTIHPSRGSLTPRPRPPLPSPPRSLSPIQDSRDSDEPPEVYVPGVPHVLPVTRWARDNAFIREVLIYDEKKRQKPRLSWYDPYDTTWVPNGWFSDGVMADMKYYFGEKK
jgi:hypothetical protein